MTDETGKTEKVDKLAKYRPSKEELEKLVKEEAEKEEKDIERLIKKGLLKRVKSIEKEKGIIELAEVLEKEKETDIPLLSEDDIEKAEKPPKRKVAGTIFDKRFPPLEESAGFCDEHGKDIIVRFNKDTRVWEPYIGETKILGKPVERFRG